MSDFFSAGLDKPSLDDEFGLADEPLTGRPERVYRCALCGAVITGTDDRFLREGADEAAFVNPAGYLFRIGFFRRAPGALPAGPGTEAHCWFPGHSWRCLFCRSCQNHLGWHFSGEADVFCGLILDRLA